MPEMPTARISTPTMVPHTLTRPGRIVVEPEEGPDQRRQQEVEADVRLPDLQLAGQHAAGEADEQPRRHEHADDCRRAPGCR